MKQVQFNFLQRLAHLPDPEILTDRSPQVPQETHLSTGRQGIYAPSDLILILTLHAWWPIALHFWALGNPIIFCPQLDSTWCDYSSPAAVLLDPLMTRVHLIYVLSVFSRMLTTKAAKISHSFLSFFWARTLACIYLVSLTGLSRLSWEKPMVTPHKRFGELLLSARAPEGHMWFISSRVTCSVTAHYKSNILKLQKWLSSQELKPVLNYSSLRQWQDQYAIIFGESLKLRVRVLYSYSVAKQRLTRNLPMRNIKPFLKQYQHILLCNIWVKF